MLIEQHTATAGTASLDFTTCFSSTYDDYLIELKQMVPTTSEKGMTLQFSNGGVFDTAGHYAWQALAMVAAGSGGNGNASDTKIWFDVAQSNESSAAFSGSYHFFGPGSALQKQITGTGFGMDTAASRIIGYSMGGQYTQTTAVDGFRIQADTGTLASGTVRCYGLAK